MGLLKDNLRMKNMFLIELGFEFSNDSGPRGEYGYTKIIHHNSNETLWITVDDKSNKLYLYNEWECGGMLWDRTIDIPSEVLNDKDLFIDWIDRQI